MLRGRHKTSLYRVNRVLYTVPKLTFDCDPKSIGFTNLHVKFESDLAKTRLYYANKEEARQTQPLAQPRTNGHITISPSTRLRGDNNAGPVTWKALPFIISVLPLNLLYARLFKTSYSIHYP